MSTVKNSPTVSNKVAVKPTAPVSSKRVTRKALPKKPAAAPAKPVTRAAAPKVAATAVKPVQTAKASPKASTQVNVAKEVKVDKVKKPKLIRDSFTIPKAEYVVMEALKERAGKLARAAKKSELLRAGIKALAAMSDAHFLIALNAVPTIKTGRPSKTI